MVPMHFVVLKGYPLLANGKVNRKALPAPIVRENETKPEAFDAMPADRIEQTLRSIWTQLGVNVSRLDQSFYEAGGSSLLAIQFLYQLFPDLFFPF